MARKIQNDVVAIDSETGDYWHGACKLQTTAEIQTAIERQACSLKKMASHAERPVREGRPSIRSVAKRTAETFPDFLSMFCARP